MKDRRRYFRIMDEVIINCYEITPEEQTIRLHEIHQGVARGFSERQPLLGLETQIRGLLQQYRENKPDLAKILEILNAKLDFMMKYVDVPQEVVQQLLNRKPRQANISACGISFNQDSMISENACVAVELVLIPEYAYMTIFGKVVRALDNDLTIDDGKYTLAIEFEHVLDDDQELLISHILKKQAQHIQAKKKGED